MVAPAALALLFLSALSSCYSSWEIEASYDLSKDGEKGPSGETAQYDPNFNTMIEIADLFSGGLVIYDDGVRFNEPRSPWNPEMYYADNKAQNGFGLITNGGYIGKGRKINGATEHLNYLEVSEALAYVHKTPGGLLYGGVGPYAAYGIGGKVKFAGGSEPAFGTDGYKRFDAGLHFLGEYRFNMGLMVGVGYDWGLYDKSNDPSDYTSRNRTMSVSVGYSVDKIVKAIKGK